MAHGRPAGPFTQWFIDQLPSSRSSRTGSELPELCAESDAQSREHTPCMYENARGKPIILYTYARKFHKIQSRKDISNYTFFGHISSSFFWGGQIKGQQNVLGHHRMPR